MLRRTGNCIELRDADTNKIVSIYCVNGKTSINEVKNAIVTAVSNYANQSINSNIGLYNYIDLILDDDRLDVTKIVVKDVMAV